MGAFACCSGPHTTTEEEVGPRAAEAQEQAALPRSHQGEIPTRTEEVEEQADTDESEWAQFDGKELEEPIKKGWIRVLDSRYLVKLARRGGAVRRRQDMPDEAFLSLDQLKLLGVVRKDVGKATDDYQTWLPLVILSYPWLTPAHPDPHGATLAAVAEALEGLEDPHGVIIDFTALPQVPRDASEDASFKSGLKSLNLFYTHPYVIVFKVTEFPDDYPTAEKYNLSQSFTPVQYNDRGWCYAESCMASLGSKPKLICDISNSDSFGGSDEKTQPPLTPTDFNRVLSTKTFTQAKTDTERVKNLYLAAFNNRIVNAKSLRFAELKWEAEDVRALAKVLESNTQMESFDLSYNFFGVEGTKVVAEVVRKHNSLLTLSLRECMLDDEEATELAKVLRVNTGLTTLDVHDNNIGEEGGMALGKALTVNKTLTTLELSENPIGDEGGMAMAKALRVNKALTKLNLGGANIGEEGGRALVEALRVNTALTTLNLAKNGLEEEGGRTLTKALKANATLTSLDLAQNTLGEEGGRAMAEVLKANTVLITLNLKETDIGDKGGKALAEALKVNTALTTLDLGFNGIKDAGGKALAEALRVNTALTTLELGVNDITDVGGKALAEALTVNTTLTKLDLVNNEIQAAGQKALEKAKTTRPGRDVRLSWN